MWQQGGGGGYGNPPNQWPNGGAMDPYMGYYGYEDPAYAAMRQMQAAQMYMQAGGPQPGDPWSEQQAQYGYMQAAAAAAAAAAGNYGNAASAQQQQQQAPLQQGQRASSLSLAGQTTPGQPKPLVGVLKRPSKMIIPVDLPKAPEADDEEEDEEDDDDDEDRKKSKSRRSSSSSSSSSRSRSRSKRSSSKIHGSSSRRKSSSSSRSGSSKSKSSDGRRHRCPLCFGGEAYDKT